MNKTINNYDELTARLESLNGETKEEKVKTLLNPAYNHTFWDFMREAHLGTLSRKTATVQAAIWCRTSMN